MLRGRGYDSVAIEFILAGPPGTREGEAEPEAKTSITIVQGSARPLLASRAVEKGEIYLVEGSARPFLREKRTHSLWEGMKGGGEGDGGKVIAKGEEDSGI